MIFYRVTPLYRYYFPAAGSYVPHCHSLNKVRELCQYTCFLILFLFLHSVWNSSICWKSIPQHVIRTVLLSDIFTWNMPYPTTRRKKEHHVSDQFRCLHEEALNAGWEDLEIQSFKLFFCSALEMYMTVKR